MYRSIIAGLESRMERLERPPVITITTDFGQYDGYVGTMKGVIYTLLPDAIHSVRNDTAAVTVSLHVYGYNLNMSGRLQFDPERDAVQSVALKLER